MPGGWGAISHGWPERAFLGRTHVNTDQKGLRLQALRVPVGGSIPGYRNHKPRWKARVCPVHLRVRRSMWMGQSEGEAMEALGVREELWCYCRKMGAREDVSREMFA